MHAAWRAVLRVSHRRVLILFSDHVSPFGNYEIAQVAYFAVAVAGLSVLMGHSGQLSLGHGALMAVGAYAVAIVIAGTAVVLGATTAS